MVSAKMSYQSASELIDNIVANRFEISETIFRTKILLLAQMIKTEEQEKFNARLTMMQEKIEARLKEE